MSDDSIAYSVIVGVIAFLMFLGFVIFLFVQRGLDGDIENTKRTKARYELCASIPDASARTLCSLDIKTGY